MPANIDEVLQDQGTTDRPAPGPWQHTILLVGVLALWALYGALRSRLSPSEMPLTVRYISSIVMQSLLVGSTLAGVYHRRQFLSAVFGRPSNRQLIKDFLQGSLIYLTGLVVLYSVRFALSLTPLHGTYRRSIVQGLLPQSELELALWILVGIAAGTSEEFIFRGYLQQQVTGWTRSVPVGIVIPALLFGCMHFYQGIAGAIEIGTLGVLYGICAWRMGSLRGAMIAHTLQDVTAGLVHYVRQA